MITIRTTDIFRLVRNEKNYHFIECLKANVVPRMKRIGRRDAKRLESVSNAEFDATANMDYGVGIHQKPNTGEPVFTY